MKTFFLIFFSSLGAILIGQQNGNEVTDFGEHVFITPIQRMPLWAACVDDSLSYRESKTCSDEMVIDFIYENLNFPTDTHYPELPKRVYPRFFIEKDGTVNFDKFLRYELPKVFEEEIKRVICLMPNWHPATMMGKPVQVSYILPISLPEQKLEIGDCYILPDEFPLFGNCVTDSLSQKEKKRCSDLALMTFLYGNIKWPPQAQCYEGRIPIQIKIEKDGSISQVRFLRETITPWKKEIRKVIDLMPSWIPGMKDGEPISVCYTFPLNITMSTD